MVWMRDFSRGAAEWRSGTRGAAAVEMALVTLLLLLPILNLVDFGVYAYSRMQVENAAQMGAQWGWSSCNSNTPGKLPATDTTKCSFLTPVSNGIQNTTLGNRVTLVSGYPSEGYYCATTTNGLTLVGTAGTVGSPPTAPNPDTCDAVANHSAPAGTAPGDYIQVGVTYTYSPLFSGLSLASLLTPTITKTVWSRLG